MKNPQNLAKEIEKKIEYWLRVETSFLLNSLTATLSSGVTKSTTVFALISASYIDFFDRMTTLLFWLLLFWNYWSGH